MIALASNAQLILIIVLGVIAAALIVRLLLTLIATLSTWYTTRYPFGYHGRDPMKCPCGYDLRGSPDTCPECGLPVPRIAGTLIRYRMRVEKLDQLEARRQSQRPPQ